MKNPFASKRVALVTDWLTNLGGAEKVLRSVSDIFPEAPIYTAVANFDRIGDFATQDIRPSFIQHIKFLRQKHQLSLPLLPRAIESLDFSEYDIVLSFSSSVAKSVKTRPDQLHVCYIHCPMRYAWEPDFDPRFQMFPKFIQPFVRLYLNHIKRWDARTASRPDGYIANSSTTQSRVKKYYDQDATVLYPPVDIQKFSLAHKKKGYYLGVGRFVHYKKFDLLVETFLNLPDKKLILAGDGPKKLELEQKAAEAKNIKFLGQVTELELQKLYSEAQAFLLPQKEDAGIVQLEAMASGTPVIAFGEGGAVDVIREGENGVFFNKQTPESLSAIIEKFETLNWKPEKIRKSVQSYDTKQFQQNYVDLVEKFWDSKP